MSNLTLAIEQVEFAKKHYGPQAVLRAEIVLAHFQKEDDEAFESDLEAFEARGWYGESLVLGGKIA